MFRIHLARFLTLGAALLLVGCNSSGSLCSSCGDRPGMFSRFRTTSSTQPVVISSGDCCNGTATGPYLPPAPIGMAPGAMAPVQQVPPPNSTIPRIDENGKQMPWDPKMSGRQGTKTGNQIQ